MRAICKKLRDALPATITWSLLLGCSGSFFYILVPAIINMYGILGWALSFFDILVFIALVSNLIMASSMDPGIHPFGTFTQFVYKY